MAVAARAPLGSSAGDRAARPRRRNSGRRAVRNRARGDRTRSGRPGAAAFVQRRNGDRRTPGRQADDGQSLGPAAYRGLDYRHSPRSGPRRVGQWSHRRAAGKPDQPGRTPRAAHPRPEERGGRLAGGRRHRGADLPKVAADCRSRDHRSARLDRQRRHHRGHLEHQSARPTPVHWLARVGSGPDRRYPGHPRALRFLPGGTRQDCHQRFQALRRCLVASGRAT